MISYSLGRDIVDLEKAVVTLRDDLSEIPDPQGFVLTMVKELSNLGDILYRIAGCHIDMDERNKLALPVILKSCENDVHNLGKLVLVRYFIQQNNRNRRFRSMEREVRAWKRGIRAWKREVRAGKREVRTYVEVKKLVIESLKDPMEAFHAIMRKHTTTINRFLDMSLTVTESLGILKRNRTSHSKSKAICVTCNDTWTPPLNVDPLPGKRAMTLDKISDEIYHLYLFRNHYMAKNQADFESWKQRHRHDEANNDPLLSPRTAADEHITSYHDRENWTTTYNSNAIHQIPFDQDWRIRQQLILLLHKDENLKTLPIRAQKRGSIYQWRLECGVRESFRIFKNDLKKEASNMIEHWVARVVKSRAEGMAYAFIKRSPEDITELRLNIGYSKISHAISSEEKTVPIRGTVILIALDFMVNSQALLRLRNHLNDLELSLSSKVPEMQKGMQMEASSTFYRTGIMASADQKQLATSDIPWKSPSPVFEDQETCFVYLDNLRELDPEASELLAFMSILGSRAISERWFPPLNGSRDTQAIEVIVALGLATRDAEESSVYSMRSSTQSLTRMWLKARGLFYKTLLSSLRHICKMSRYLNRRAKERIHASLSHAELWAKRVPTVTMKGKFRMHAFCMLLFNTGRILSAVSGLSAISSLRKAGRRVERSYRYLLLYSPEISPRRFSGFLVALYHHQLGRKEALRRIMRMVTGATNTIFSFISLILLPFPASIGIVLLTLDFFSSLHTRRSGLSRPTPIRKDDRMLITIPIESIFSLTTLESDTVDDFVNYFTATLVKDGLILSLLKTVIASQTMPRSRIQHNLCKLLNFLAKDLQRESSALEIRALEEFISKQTLRISTSMLNTIDGGKAISGLPSTPLNSEEKAIAFLESYVVSGVPHTAAEEMSTVEMGDFGDDLCEDIHDALEDRILSDDLTKQLSGVMEPLNDLFSRSLAYHDFRLRIYSLAYPTVSSRALHLIERWSSPQDPNNPLVSRYRLKELVTSLENVEPKGLRVEEPLSSTRCSISYYQRKVETFTNSSWDWWPLPPPVQPTKEGESRLTWKCVSALQ